MLPKELKPKESDDTAEPKHAGFPELRQALKFACNRHCVPKLSINAPSDGFLSDGRTGVYQVTRIQYLLQLIFATGEVEEPAFLRFTPQYRPLNNPVRIHWMTVPHPTP